MTASNDDDNEESVENSDQANASAAGILRGVLRSSTSSAATFESASFMSIGFCVEMCRKDDPLFDNTTFVGLQVSRKKRSYSMKIKSSLLAKMVQLFCCKIGLQERLKDGVFLINIKSSW